MKHFHHIWIRIHNQNQGVDCIELSCTSVCFCSEISNHRQESIQIRRTRVLIRLSRIYIRVNVIRELEFTFFLDSCTHSRRVRLLSSNASSVHTQEQIVYERIARKMDEAEKEKEK